MNKKLLLFLSIFNVTTILSRDNATNDITSFEPITELENIIYQYFMPPEELLDALKNPNIISEKNTITDATQFISKGHDIQRLFLAQRMRTCIEQCRLNKLKVPRKYFYNKNIIAEKIDLDMRSKLILNLDEVHQIIKLIEETGYADFGVNIGRDIHDKKIVFFDTEEKSFDDSSKPKSDLIKNFLNEYCIYMEKDVYNSVLKLFNLLKMFPEKDTCTPEGGLFNTIRFDQNIQTTKLYALITKLFKHYEIEQKKAQKKKALETLYARLRNELGQKYTCLEFEKIRKDGTPRERLRRKARATHYPDFKIIKK